MTRNLEYGPGSKEENDSPPSPYTQMVEDLRAIAKWATQTSETPSGEITDDSLSREGVPIDQLSD